MKFEIDDNQLIEKIADKVIKQIKPLLNHEPKNDKLMDVKGLADYLQVKETWVYDKVHKREIPFYKAGKFPRFRKKHIDIWLCNPYHPDLSIYNLNLI